MFRSPNLLNQSLTCPLSPGRVQKLMKVYQSVHESVYLEALRKATTAMMYTVSDLTREKNEYDTTYFLSEYSYYLLYYTAQDRFNCIVSSVE